MISKPKVHLSDCVNKIKIFFHLLLSLALFQHSILLAQDVSDGMAEDSDSIAGFCSGIGEGYEDEYRACIRMEIARGAGGNVDCVECLFNNVEKSNPWDTAVDALSAIAAPLAMVGSTWIGSYYQSKNAKEWASAYAKGQEACTTRFGNYLSQANELAINTQAQLAETMQTSLIGAQQECTKRVEAYKQSLQQYGAPPMSSDVMTQINQSCLAGMKETFQGVGGFSGADLNTLIDINGQCMGSPLSAYAGFGGMMGGAFGGTGNPFLQAGYSGGFMGSMLGPNFGYGGMGGYGAGTGFNASIGFNPGGGALGTGLGLLGGLLSGRPINIQGGIGAGLGGMGGMPGFGMGGMPGFGMGGMPGLGGGISGGINLGGGGFGMPGFGIGGLPGFGGGFGTPGFGGGINIGGGIGMPGLGGGFGTPGFGGGINIGGGIGMPGLGGGGFGTPGFGGGINIGGGTGMPGLGGGGFGTPGFGGGFGSPGFGGGFGNPGFGGGINIGGGIGAPGIGGGYYNGSMGLGAGYPGGFGYFGNTGGFNGGANAEWYQNQLKLQQEMIAAQKANAEQSATAARLNQGAAVSYQQSNQALYENYINAFKDLYGSQSMYGSSPYSFGNMHGGLSAGAGFNMSLGF